MSFSLSFAPEFYSLPGEMYDGAEYPHGDRPYSVVGALRAMTDDQWCDLAVDVFGLGDDMADYLTIEDVLSRIEDTDTCTDLRSPVTVWIDPEGYYTVDVYDHEGRDTL